MASEFGFGRNHFLSEGFSGVRGGNESNNTNNDTSRSSSNMTNHDESDQGFLTTEYVVHLKFLNNAITIWKRRFRDKPFRIAIRSIDMRRKESDVNEMQVDFDEETNSNDIGGDYHLMEIAALNDHDYKFVRQHTEGHQYNENEFLMFRSKMNPNEIERTAYRIELYLSISLSDPQHVEPLGSCFLLPGNLQHESSGTVTMPITGTKNQPIGQMTLEYLIIKPLKDYQNFNNLLNYASIWNPIKSGFDIGHRGAGSARRSDKEENILENTIASFNYAYKHGADMIELDVQLTKDKVPVIYHDYNVNISMKRKTKFPQEDEMLQIALKDLTEHQMHLLKISPVHKANKSKYDFEESDHEENQPFPTLKKVLESVDQHCGFNVEIKYPQARKDGSWEAEKGLELNEYVDIILRTIFESAGTRYIMISCFHPDICSMIRLKQNKYPLLFLTQGKTEKYIPFADPRNHTVQSATYFALAMGFLGINVHAEDLLKDRNLIRFVKSKGLVLFCWGDDLNGTDVIEDVKKEGVDGVIYDKIDLYVSKVFVAEHKETRKELLEMITGQSRESLTAWGSRTSLERPPSSNGSVK